MKPTIFHFHLLNFCLQFRMLNLPNNVFYMYVIYTGGGQFSEKYFVYTTFEEMQVIFPNSDNWLLFRAHTL